MGVRMWIGKWGRSLAVRIPKAIAQRWGVSVGSGIEMTLRGDQVAPKVLAGVEEIDCSLAPRLTSAKHAQHRDLLVVQITAKAKSMHAAHRFARAIIGEEPTRPQATGEPYLTRWRDRKCRHHGKSLAG